MKGIKFYGKTLQTWKHWVTKIGNNGKTYEYEEDSQYEISYKEYFDGELVSVGSEDFSPERLIKTLKTYRIFTWDGQKYNKGGYRWWECEGTVWIPKDSKKTALEIVKSWYPKSAMIELR